MSGELVGPLQRWVWTICRRYGFAAFRLIIGTVSMFFVVGLLGKFIVPDKQDLKIIFSIGFLQIALFMVFITIGLYYVDAGRSAVLVYTTPLWVVPISVLVFQRKTHRRKMDRIYFGIDRDRHSF